MTEVLKGLTELSQREPLTLALVALIAIVILMLSGGGFAFQVFMWYQARDKKRQQIEENTLAAKLEIEKKEVAAQIETEVANNRMTEAFLDLIKTMAQHDARRLEQAEQTNALLSRQTLVMETLTQSYSSQNINIQDMLIALQTAASNVSANTTRLNEFGQTNVALLDSADKIRKLIIDHDGESKSSRTAILESVDRTRKAVLDHNASTDEHQRHITQQIDLIRKDVVEKFEDVRAKVLGLESSLAGATLGAIREDLTAIQTTMYEAVGGIAKLALLMQPSTPLTLALTPAVGQPPTPAETPKPAEGHV